MRVDHSLFTVKKSGSLQSMKFGIDNEGIIFDILSTKLYKNPLKILIQEYMCNARDSHREALRNRIPIDVILPTAIDPYIQFIDYGVGISPERISKVFVKLGNSTKTDSDKETGGYGVGAKTAWSYIDSFTIITIFDKIEYRYIAYIDNGVGKLDLISKIETDNRNGTVIKINIKANDFEQAEQYVFKTSFFWKTRPNIINSSMSFNDYDFEYVQDLSAAVVNSVNNYSYLSDDGENVVIVIDGIIYDSVDNYINLNIFDLRYSNTTVYLFFDTSELKPVINRESIFKDSNTVNILNLRINKLYESICNSIDLSGVENIKDICDVITGIDLTRFRILKKFKVTNENFNIYYENEKFYIDLAEYGYCSRSYTFSKASNIMKSISVSDKLYLSGNELASIIVINDKFTKTVNNTKIKQFCKNKDSNQIIIITTPYKKTPAKTEKITTLFKLLSSLDNVHNYSDMFRTTQVVTNTDCYYYSINDDSWYQSEATIRLEFCDIFDLKKKYSRYVLYKGRKSDIVKYVRMLNLYNDFADNSIVILKYNKNLKNNIDSTKILALVDLEDLFRSYLIKNIEKINICHYFYYTENLKYASLRIDDDRFRKLIDLNDHIDCIDDIRFKKFIRNAHQFYLKLKGSSSLNYDIDLYKFWTIFQSMSVTEQVEVEIKKNYFNRKLRKYKESMNFYYKKYPIIEYIDYYYSDDVMYLSIVDYINVCNKVKNV
jgi:hypothetical protein